MEKKHNLSITLFTVASSPLPYAEKLKKVREIGYQSIQGGFQAGMTNAEHKALLDSLGFDNPIVCTHISGHLAVYNTAAMRRCGVDDSFTDPPGGHAVRDAEGHLTG